MSLLDRPVSRPVTSESLFSEAPRRCAEVIDIFTRKQQVASDFTAYGSTLLDFYEEDKELKQAPPYQVSYELVGVQPNVLVLFELSQEGEDKYLAFISGCFRDDGSREIYARELPFENYGDDEKKYGAGFILCMNITATDLSVEQIIKRGMDRRIHLGKVALG